VRTLSRREFLAGAATALVAAACTSGAPPPPTTPATLKPRSIKDLARGAVQLSLLHAQSELPVGRSLFTFGLSTEQGGLLEEGSPQVFAAPDEDSAPIGPFSATFFRFAPASEFNDKTIPRSAITGFYSARVDVPRPGPWVFAAVAVAGGRRAVGVGASPVKKSVPNAAGSRATSFPTPTATTKHGLEEICTRKPPDPMHHVALGDAMKNGKPTVVSFATPLLCESRLCGPVVDEQLLVFEKEGRGRANFIHVEEFLPGPDLKPPGATLENRSPAFKAWHLTTEPWVFVIDARGVIRQAFEGPVVAAQIEAALNSLR
jgi:hypothetical protein